VAPPIDDPQAPPSLAWTCIPHALCATGDVGRLFGLPAGPMVPSTGTF